MEKNNRDFLLHNQVGGHGRPALIGIALIGVFGAAMEEMQVSLTLMLVLVIIL